MDYFDILKRAWKVTWKYKALWILGFFIGGSGGGSGGSGYQYGGNSNSDPTGAVNAFSGIETWIANNLAIVAAAAALLAIFATVMWVLSIAAQGGLVHLVNEADENRAVSLRDGWRVGFKYWGRTFMIGLLLAIPVLIVFGVMALVFGASIAGLIAAGSTESAGAAAAGGIGGLCCGLPVFILLLLGAGLVVSVVSSLAIRYGVLQDVTFGQAIAKGWHDLWGKRGAFIFWLVMLLPGFAYSAVTGVIAALFAVPALLMIMADKVVSGAVLLAILFLVLLIPGAVYGTFVSSAWTIFFRRMHGIGVPEKAQTAPAYSADILPPPPAPPAPQAAPVPAPESPPDA